MQEVPKKGTQVVKVWGVLALGLPQQRRLVHQESLQKVRPEKAEMPEFLQKVRRTLQLFLLQFRQGAPSVHIQQ